MILMRIHAVVVGAELRQLHRRHGAEDGACIRGVLSECSGVLADRRLKVGNRGQPVDGNRGRLLGDG
jgi:hypothetical protein